MTSSSEERAQQARNQARRPRGKRVPLLNDGAQPGLVRLSKSRLLISGTQSGVGKTTFTVGLCGALRSMGLRVSMFKCGPDYLDPTWHAKAAGVRSHTLDSWMMGRDAVLSTFARASQDSDIALIEGAMGLFDGSDAEIAKWLDAPVLLIADTSGMAGSIAALAAGFASFDPDLRFAGLICNRVGSRNHLSILREACTATPVLGGLPKDTANSFPSRHLGLHAADGAGISLDTWAKNVSEWCDLDRILTVARAAPPVPTTCTRQASQPTRCRLAVAMDEAFSFYYEENLRLLQAAGAELIKFSPIHDSALPSLVNGIYFGGGYPEVHAAHLSDNTSMLESVRAFCHSGKPVYAECGGLMYLCSEIRQLDGARYPMVGWFHAYAQMCDRFQALGYVEATTTTATLLGPAGETFRGHQFRYSALEWQESTPRAYTIRKRRGNIQEAEGFTRGNVLGSYIHAHWASNPEIPGRFINGNQY